MVRVKIEFKPDGAGWTELHDVHWKPGIGEIVVDEDGTAWRVLNVEHRLGHGEVPIVTVQSMFPGHRRLDPPV